MKEFQQHIYSTAKWKKCRAAYIKSVSGLCEACSKNGMVVAGEELHHIIPLTPDNCSDDSLVYGWDNLQYLCRTCHATMHKKNKTDRRYTLDEMGRVTFLDV